MSMPELGRQTQNVAFCLQFVPLMTAATARKDPWGCNSKAEGDLNRTEEKRHVGLKT